MSDEKKKSIAGHTEITTGGLGAVLTTLVPLIAPDTNSELRPVLYALAPLISAMITYFMVWVINRHGLESPAEAALRNRLQRDIKEIDEQLKNKHLTPSLEKQLLKERELTVIKLVNIGKTLEVRQAEIENEK